MKIKAHSQQPRTDSRAVGRSENPVGVGGQLKLRHFEKVTKFENLNFSNVVGQSAPLVEIGLNDLPPSAQPGPPDSDSPEL
jgi:hypothetical protein